MQSAFGIDHGEIAKARFVRPPRRGMFGRPTKAQRQTVGKPGDKTGPQKVAAKLKRASEADVSLAGVGTGAGKALKGVGGFLERRPGLTGTALVGGGGAASYKYLSEKQPKKGR